MQMKWSNIIEERFQIHLPTDLRDWFDSEIWKLHSGHGFQEGIHPDDIVQGNIWYFGIPPNFLPIVEDGFGRCLALEINPTGETGDIIRYDSSCGEYAPIAKKYSEALLFDAAMFILRADPEVEKYAEQPFVFASWAQQHTNCNKKFWENPTSDPMKVLYENKLSEYAVRHQMCLRCLNSSYRNDFLKHITVPQDWIHLFDASSENLLKLAADAAQEIVDHRQDLSWPIEVLGQWFELQGDSEEIINIYRKGIFSSVLTGEWGFQQALKGCIPKFCVHKLMQMNESLDRLSTIEREYLSLYQDATSTSDLRLSISEFWQNQGEHFLNQNNPASAYLAFFASGWDLGFPSTEKLHQIYQQMIECCRQMNLTSVSELAKIQQEKLL